MDGAAEERWHVLADCLAADRPPCVVDIGANPLDDPPYKPLLDAGLCTLHGFEPQAAAFARLQEARGPNEVYQNSAVGDGRPHSFNIYRQSGLSSIFSLDRAAMRFLGRNERRAALMDQVQIATTRLDDVDAISRIDLLKIDVQGAETLIFEHGRKKLSEAVAVITELRFFPLYETEPLLDTQISLLSDLGLRFHKFLFVKGQHIQNSQSARLRTRALASQALDGDAVFVRDLRHPQSVSDAQIRALALLADATFGSYDLTLHCLDLLVDRGRVDPQAPATYADLLPSDLLPSDMRRDR